MPNRATFLTAAAAGSAALAATPGLGRPEAAYAAAGSDEVAAATRGMTFATLRDDGVDHLGARTARGVVNIAASARLQGIPNPPASVDDLVNGIGNVAAMPRLVANAPAEAIRPVEAVQFGPLVSRPRKILCVGLNYAAHLAEAGEKARKFPDMFSKYNTTLNRHGGTIAVSQIPAEHFDYESELVMIMAKTARNVPEAQALSYVYGYAAGNDFSARDLQFDGTNTQWLMGKTPDQFAPLGPWLVTADQIPDPQTLQIRTFVNDEMAPRQDMNTSQMIFGCAKIIAYLSRYITLEAGDVIFTGTPSGVILGMPKDKQVWLKPGDRIRTEISHLGELRFRLV